MSPGMGFACRAILAVLPDSISAQTPVFLEVRATFRGIGTVTRLVATHGFRPAAG